MGQFLVQFILLGGSILSAIQHTLSRFLLLAAFHDTVEKGNGQLEVGKNGTHPTLTFQAWLDDKYSSVEHVAPQSNKNGWSTDLYDDEFDRLENLTLLPTNANQSLSDRPWEQKRSLFAALAANTQAESESIIAAMKEQGVDLSKIAGTIYCGKFLPHVHAISGIKETWDLDVVDKRGRELAELAWNRLSPWLNVKDAL